MKAKPTLFLKLAAYTLILVGAGALLFWGASRLADQVYDDIQYDYLGRQLDKLASQLAKEEYAGLKYDAKLFGDGRRLAVVGGDGSLVYRFSGSQSGLSAAELAFVDPADGSQYTSVVSYLDEDHGALVSVSVDSNASGYSQIYIYDAAGELVYSNQKDAKQLSSPEVQFLEDEQSGLIKYRFITETGKVRYLIAEVSDAARYGYTAAYEESNKVYYGLAGAYLILIVGYVWLISRTVVSPLRALNEAIRSHTATAVSREKERQGTAEFYEIFDNYERMMGDLDEEKQKRERLESERNELLSDISHDLKTPMTVIKGYTKALRDGLVPERERNKVYDMIDGKAVYLGTLIDQFAEYSKLDRPGFYLTKELVEVRELLRQITAEKYNEMTEAGIRVTVDLEGEPCYVLADAVQFRRAVYNILDNAIKHCASGTEVRIAAATDKEKIRIRIEDSGSGIPEDIRGRIFAPFVVTDKSRHRSGSGLGLAISRRIIRDHEGELALAEPSVGFATCFLITLPVAYKTVNEL